MSKNQGVYTALKSAVNCHELVKEMAVLFDAGKWRRELCHACTSVRIPLVFLGVLKKYLYGEEVQSLCYPFIYDFWQKRLPFHPSIDPFHLHALNCLFLHDVTKIQTKKLSILPKFYFHDALQQLKTSFHTSIRFKRVLGFVIEYAWISKLLRDAPFTWRPRELSCRLKKWLISGHFAIKTVHVLEKVLF